ncbi:MAG: beta-Ala-His dipeptidase [Clostridia bacterium]|nr:beta-Ala-His dipeptidase [Clostridia bacterium]
MDKLGHISPADVFGYFEALTRIPHGSGNMEKISRFCMDFAEKHGLEAERDAANNVIIRKPGAAGYETAKPVILQGHLDMVCQKEENADIEFETDGLEIYADDEYIRAHGTTLGADNGIAAAMMLAILADDTLSHPPIEAVFTTDEEIGMVGALALDMSRLKGKRMINMDSENPAVVTVSCAGGSDFAAHIPVKRSYKNGRCVRLRIKGLAGGHSGVEIDKGRVNANLLMGRILNHLRQSHDFGIIRLDGGDKGNAIPTSCTAELFTGDAGTLTEELRRYTEIVGTEIRAREAGFSVEITISDEGDFAVIDTATGEKLLYYLLLAPNGVQEMSAEIHNLVETSLNLGILKTEEDTVTMAFALRSNKKTALAFLEEKLAAFFGTADCQIVTGGHYPPWEYRKGSEMERLYMEKYKEKTGEAPRVEAIHAGLECGVFAAGIPGLDCISIGPEMHGIHTVHEKLSIRGTKILYEIVLEMLKAMR